LCWFCHGVVGVVWGKAMSHGRLMSDWFLLSVVTHDI
jgi:hypothetical protein